MNSHHHVHDSKRLSEEENQHSLSHIGFSAVVFVMLVLLYMITHWAP